MVCNLILSLLSAFSKKSKKRAQNLDTEGKNKKYGKKKLQEKEEIQQGKKQRDRENERRQEGKIK